MDNFWKMFATLFSIGAAITFAKSLKSKKKLKETVAECIIGGAAACSASSILLFYPTAPFIAVAGVGIIITLLGVAFFSDKLEDAIDRSIDKFIGKKDGT